jgi:hypothetical protein
LYECFKDRNNIIHPHGQVDFSEKLSAYVHVLGSFHYVAIYSSHGCGSLGREFVSIQ